MSDIYTTTGKGISIKQTHAIQNEFAIKNESFDAIEFVLKDSFMELCKALYSENIIEPDKDYVIRLKEEVRTDEYAGSIENYTHMRSTISITPVEKIIENWESVVANPIEYIYPCKPKESDDERTDYFKDLILNTIT